MYHSEFNDLISKLDESVYEVLRIGNKFILVPRGCLRGEIARRLGENGFVIYSYKGGDFHIDDAISVTMKNEKVAIVPPDLKSAAEIAKSIDDVTVVFLPSIYARILGIHERNIYYHVDFKDAAKALGIKLIPSSRGVIPSLIRDDENLGRNVKLLLGLGAAATGFIDLTMNYGKTAINIISTIVGSIPAIHLAIIPLSTSLSIYELFRKRERTAVLKPFVEFTRVVKDIKDLDKIVDDERYEAILDEIAAEYGMGFDEFRNIVKNLHRSIIKGQEITMNELEKLVNERINDIISKIEPRIKIFEELHGIYTLPDDLPYTRYKEGKYLVRVDPEHDVGLVEVGGFSKLINEVEGRLSREDFVVVVGEHGLGKSTLAWVVATKLLVEGRVNVIVGVVPGGLSMDELRRLEYDNEWRGLSKVIVYDPITPEAYTRFTPRAYRAIAEDVVTLALEVSGMKIVVLTKDMLEELRRTIEGNRRWHDVLRYLDNAVEVNVDKLGREFIREVIRAYSGDGCRYISNEHLDGIAQHLVGIGGGATVIAKYVGEWLRGNNCNIEEVTKGLEKPFREAIDVMTYIAKAMLGITGEVPFELAKFLQIRRWFTNNVQHFSYISTPTLTEEVMRELGVNEEIIRRGHFLLSMRKEDLFEAALDELMREGGVTNIPTDEDEVIKLLKRPGRQGKPLLNALAERIQDYGSQCPARTTYLVGAVLLGHPRLEGEVKESLNRVGGPCAIDRLMLMGDAIPPLTFNLIHYATREHIRLVSDVEACSELSKVNLRDERWYGNWYWHPYAAGLATLALIDKKCNEKALNILDWAISNPGIQVTTMLNTVLKLLEELLNSAKSGDELDELTEVFGRVIGRYYGYPGVCAKLQGILSKLWGNYTNLSLISRVNLAFIYAREANVCSLPQDKVKEFINKAEEVMGDVRSLDEDLWIVSMGDVYTDLAEAYLDSFNDLESAERILGMVEEVMNKLKDLEGRGIEKISRNALRYLELDYPEEPAKALQEAYLYISKWLDYIYGKIEYYRYRVMGIDGSLNNAIERSRRAAEKDKLMYEKFSKGIDLMDYINYIEDFNAYAERLYVAGYEDEAYRVFEDLWREVSGRLYPNADYLSKAARTLANYIVSLALRGMDFQMLLDNYGWLLQYRESMRLKLSLFLSVLGYDALRINEREIINYALTNYIRPDLGPIAQPAFKYAHGLIKREEAEEECKGLSSGHDYCLMFIKAVDGDETAMEKLREQFMDMVNKALNEKSEFFRRWSIEARDFEKVINKLRGKELVEVFVTEGRLLLFLKALIEDNCGLARAHTLTGTLYSYARLYAETYKALSEDCRTTDKLKKALAKQYYS